MRRREFITLLGGAAGWPFAAGAQQPTLPIIGIFVGGNTPSVRAAIAATTTPIVFTTGTDPVTAGLVDSLNRPGGNATGVTFLAGEIGPKQLDLLRELTPKATKIALLTNPRNPLTSGEDIQGIGATASRIGLEIVVLNGSSEEEIGAIL